MTRNRGEIRLHIVTFAASVAALWLTVGCAAPPCERPTVELATDPVEHLRKSRQVRVTPSVQHRASHIRVGCTAHWTGEGGVRVSVCALGQCTHAEGPQAYVDLWPQYWDQLHKLEHVSCIVVKKEQQVFEGLWFDPVLVETLPEKTLLAAQIPVVTGCEAAPEGSRYCANGRWENDRWVCTRWNR